MTVTVTKPAVDPEAAIALASASSGPILFADTCAYLDLVRLATRDKPRLHHTLPQVLKLRDALGNGTMIFSAEIAAVEYARNITNVYDEAIQTESRVDAAVKRFVAAAKFFGALASDPDVAGLEVVKQLRELADQMINATTYVASSQAIIGRAHRRQSAFIRPAQRGKDNLGDCLIAETLLELAGGGRWKTVFLTSNTKDFSDRGQPHADLAPDFTANNISTAYDWQWAVHELAL